MTAFFFKNDFFFLFVLSVLQIAYKSDYKHDGVDYNYPATLTPSYQTTRKLVPLKDVNHFVFWFFVPLTCMAYHLSSGETVIDCMCQRMI